MNLNDFDRLIAQPLKGKVPNLNLLRVQSAYAEMHIVNDLINETITGIGGRDIFNLAQGGSQQEALEIVKLQQRMRILLKTLFIYTDQFVSILLSEVVGRLGVSLNDFLKRPLAPITSLSTSRILPAYCVVIYRNKLVAHHDVKRISGFKIMRGGSEMALVPLPGQFHLDPSDVSELQRLAGQYQATIPGLIGTSNQFIQLNLLFYNIPLGTLRPINPDRIKINSIAEHGGCESYTPTEVIKAMDDFSVAIVSTV